VELTQFEGQDKKELSMIEVAHAIFDVTGEVMDFADLLNEIANYLGLTDEELEENMTQFYTDLNIDGSFISLGDNRWGLRAWYPVDSIDEEITHDNDKDEERPRRKKRKKKRIDDDFEEDEEDDEEEDEFDDEFDEDEDDEDEEEDTPPVVSNDDDKLDYGERVKVDEHGVLVDDEDEEDLGEYEADLSDLGDSDEALEDELTVIDEDDMEDDEDDE